MINPINSFNPFSNYIRQSDMNAETIISDFEKVYSAGMDPNATFQQILQNRKLSVNDFSDPDLHRIKRKITSIYHSVMNTRR